MADLDITILGLTGKKGHGKDSFARMLVEENPAFKRIAFADELKRICCTVFGLTRKQVTNPEEKELALPHPIELDKQLTALQDETKLNLKPLGMVARTPRQVLQFIGTDYVRGVKDSYWVDHVIRQMLHDPDTAWVVTDLRFINEADKIRELGGLVVKILRLAKSDSAVPEHASEELNFDPDYTFAVMENNWTLPRYFAQHSQVPSWMEVYLEDFDWARRDGWEQKGFEPEDYNGPPEIYRLIYYGDLLKTSAKTKTKVKS